LAAEVCKLIVFFVILGMQLNPEHAQGMK
jgi:hypothetical protein